MEMRIGVHPTSSLSPQPGGAEWSIAVSEETVPSILSDQLMEEAVQKSLRTGFWDQPRSPQPLLRPLPAKGKTRSQIPLHSNRRRCQATCPAQGGTRRLDRFFHCRVRTVQGRRHPGTRRIKRRDANPPFPNFPRPKEQGVDAIHGLMQFWWAPQRYPSRADRLFGKPSARKPWLLKTVQAPASRTCISIPSLKSGKPLLRETIKRQRSANLKGIVPSRKPTPSASARVDRAIAE